MNVGESWVLLRAPEGTCEQCAVDHEPFMFHDQQSLHWQYWFYAQHGRWPTWRDAAAHCAPGIVDALIEVLDRNEIDHDLREGR